MVKLTSLPVYLNYFLLARHESLKCKGLFTKLSFSSRIMVTAGFFRGRILSKDIAQKNVEGLTASLADMDFAEAVMQVSIDPVFIADSSGSILFSSAAVERVFGYKPADVTGRKFDAVLLTDEFQDFASFLVHYKENGGGSAYGQYIHARSKSGQTIKVITAIRDYASGGSTNKIIVMRDISEELKLRREKSELEHHYTEMLFAQSHYESQASQVVDIAEALAHEKEKVEESKRIIEHQASHDPLTGLGNRILMEKAFFELLTKAKACLGGVGFIYIDLDGFKKVNDDLGHKAGDQLLCDASARIKDSIGPDDVAIRLGGDEFGIIVYLKDENETEIVFNTAEKLLKAVRFDVRDDNGEIIKVSASIGIAHYPRDGHTLDMLLHSADNAMYEAKKSGKARIC